MKLRFIPLRDHVRVMPPTCMNRYDQAGLWQSPCHLLWWCHWQHLFIYLCFKLSPFWEPWVQFFPVPELRIFLLFFISLLISYVPSGGLCLLFKESKTLGWKNENGKLEFHAVSRKRNLETLPFYLWNRPSLSHGMLFLKKWYAIT